MLGNRDLLVQVFLNLLKNAAEAAPAEGGEIVLTTQYQQGVRIAPPGSEARLSLPIVASIQDNGSGIPDDLRAHLFDPFVTGKADGTADAPETVDEGTLTVCSDTPYEPF